MRLHQIGMRGFRRHTISLKSEAIKEKECESGKKRRIKMMIELIRTYARLDQVK